MKVDIQASDFSMTKGLTQAVVSACERAFYRHSERIGTVRVRLSDINGRRGGVDKVCLVAAQVHGGGAIAVSDLQADLYVAIDNAFDKAARALSTRSGRRRSKARHQREPMFAELD